MRACAALRARRIWEGPARAGRRPSTHGGWAAPDGAGKVQEHNEYFAFGATWIDERRDLDNDGRQDYLFTGKELARI